MQNIKQEAILESGFAQAKKITQKYARTFYFASPFLSKERRRAAFAVYALCRIADDYVDTNDPDAAYQELSKISLDIDTAYAKGQLKDPLLLAFRDSIEKFDIPKNYFSDILAGMRMDLHKNRYANFDELYDYCYKVAGAVGLIMLQIFDADAHEAREYAVDLGVALQLTNIVRDIKEDYARGRIYLPQDEMHKFGITPEDIASHNLNQNFKELLMFQIQRARQYYCRSLAGLSFIKNKRSRFLILAIKRMYAAILDTIEKKDFDIFSARAQVSNLKKIALLSGIIFKAK